MKIHPYRRLEYRDAFLKVLEDELYHLAEEIQYTGNSIEDEADQEYCFAKKTHYLLLVDKYNQLKVELSFFESEGKNVAT